MCQLTYSIPFLKLQSLIFYFLRIDLLIYQVGIIRLFFWWCDNLCGPIFHQFWVACFANGSQDFNLLGCPCNSQTGCPCNSQTSFSLQLQRLLTNFKTCIFMCSIAFIKTHSPKGCVIESGSSCSHLRLGCVEVPPFCKVGLEASLRHHPE